MNITVIMLNYNSFLLNITNTNFIISKRLYQASFKLNIVNFPDFTPWSPTEGLIVPPDSQLHFMS